jgi:23S rRNA pseudouridine2605 synthase
MCEAVGHTTLKLTRIGYGILTLGGLKVGKYRHLNNMEVKALRKSVGLD